MAGSLAFGTLIAMKRETDNEPQRQCHGGSDAKGMAKDTASSLEQSNLIRGMKMKAFDLLEYKYVACKLPGLNAQITFTRPWLIETL